jgi:hypothetical protein
VTLECLTLALPTPRHRPSYQPDRRVIVPPLSQGPGWFFVPLQAYLTSGWALNAKVPARSRRGQWRSTRSALSGALNSSARVALGGSWCAAVRPRGGRGRARASSRQQLTHTLGRERPIMGRAMTGGVQLLRHPAGSPARGLPIPQPLPHRRRVADLVPASHASADRMLGHRAASPMQLHLHLLARRRCPHHHALQQQPHHLALLHHRGRGRLP